jgi:hypothetical protein
MPGMMSGGFVLPSSRPAPKPDRRMRYVQVPVSLKEMEGAIPKASSTFVVDLVMKGFDSDPPRTLISGFPGASIALVKRNSYWIQPCTWANVPKRFKNRTEGNVVYGFSLPPCNRLMVSNGEKCEFTGLLLEQTELRAGSDGVYWMEGTAKDRKLCYLPAGAKAPIKLPNYAGMGFPDECNGKVYWLEIPPKAIGDTTNEPPDKVELKCANVGLDRVQSIMLVKVGNPPPDMVSVASKLCVSNGHLYLISPDWTGAEKLAITDTPGQHVYEIVVGEHPDLRLCCNLPTESTFTQIDHGYCYYFVRERRESWWDWSQKGLVPEQVSVMFRRPLQ